MRAPGWVCWRPWRPGAEPPGGPGLLLRPKARLRGARRRVRCGSAGHTSFKGDFQQLYKPCGLFPMELPNCRQGRWRRGRRKRLACRERGVERQRGWGGGETSDGVLECHLIHALTEHCLSKCYVAAVVETLNIQKSWQDWLYMIYYMPRSSG